MPSLTCPHCRRFALEPTYYQNVEIDVCTHCGGMWFDKTELDRVIHQYDPEYPKRGPIVASLGRCTHDARWTCPSCRSALDTFEFEEGSNLQIDVCRQCSGIWLDKGELANARAFYEIPDAMSRINEKRTWGHWFFQFLLQLPVEFNIKPRRIPAVTLTLIALNVIVFLAGISDLISPSFFYAAVLIPADVGSPNWFTGLITYQFLHGSLFHLAGNMYFLYILGDNLEDALGRVRFTLFYLICGIAGGVLHTLANIDLTVPVVGASGAIAGVMAGYAYTFRKAKLTFLFIVFQWKLSVYWYFSIWVAINITGVFLSSDAVAWFAHLGGFIAGLGIIALLYPTIIRNNPLICYLNHAANTDGANENMGI